MTRVLIEDVAAALIAAGFDRLLPYVALLLLHDADRLSADDRESLRAIIADAQAKAGSGALADTLAAFERACVPDQVRAVQKVWNEPWPANSES